MTQKIFIVEGRQFRTQTDYNRAMHDKEIIDNLRAMAVKYNTAQLRQLKKELQSGKYNFYTLLGQDYEDEIDELLKRQAVKGKKGGGSKLTGERRQKGNAENAEEGKKQKDSGDKETSGLLDVYVREELKRRERRRRLLILCCSIMAACCLGYFAVYSYFDYRTTKSYNELNALKEKPATDGQTDAQPVIHYTADEKTEQREVLEEYKNLINKNKKLIGWVKIDDTNIDYPVMQTVDNEYYLDHNINQEYDKNGSIFMDKDCDVLKPSMNYILYGHHMKNGKMFGSLHLYSDKSYYEKHPYIQFDTIYEKGTYEIMYVFRSRVYSEEEIVFKYYQFIDAVSEQEFDSNMQEMASLSFYDTGVTAQYGDQLLTLSTCDYQEKDGRFVVVAKKVTKE